MGNKKKLDVKLTDQVFVLSQGHGTVIKVLPDRSFVVKVPGRGEVHYTPYGTVGAAEDVRVFWEDPMITVPPKNPRLWAAFRRLALVLYDELEQLDKAGVIREGPDGTD
jgi:hypothetical protein